MAHNTPTGLDQIQAIIDKMRADHDKFYNKGNNAAGVRTRGFLQEIVEASKAMRKDIQQIKNDKKAQKTKNVKNR